MARPNPLKTDNTQSTQPPILGDLSNDHYYDYCWQPLFGGIGKPLPYIRLSRWDPGKSGKYLAAGNALWVFVSQNLLVQTSPSSRSPRTSFATAIWAEIIPETHAGSKHHHQPTHVLECGFRYRTQKALYPYLKTPIRLSGLGRGTPSQAAAIIGGYLQSAMSDSILWPNALPSKDRVYFFCAHAILQSLFVGWCYERGLAEQLAKSLIDEV